MHFKCFLFHNKCISRLKCLFQLIVTVTVTLIIKVPSNDVAKTLNRDIERRERRRERERERAI